MSSRTLLHLAVASDAIVVAATVEAVLLFGSPADAMGFPVDMRHMLGFAACGVAGAALLTVAACGRASAVWAAIAFEPPGLLSLYIGRQLFHQDASPALVATLGLPVLAYAGGCAVSALAAVSQSQGACRQGRRQRMGRR